MATQVADAPKRPRKAREDLPQTPNPLDLAMAAAVSGKQLPDVARRVLEEEARLLHAQCTELRLREIGERVRAGLWSILGLAALAIVGLIVFISIKAARSDALVVESFRVPPAMASQGLSGEVLAKQVLDKVAEFQDSTESVRAPTSYDNNWGDDLKIDIPQTGATADQLWKLLRQSLGKETRISGEVVEAKGGLAMTTRVGSTPGQRFVGPADDLDGIVSTSAEHILSATQPYRYALYLDRAGRHQEALVAFQQLTADPSPTERKWAYNGLSKFLRTQGDLHGSIAAAARALAIDNNMIPAVINLSVGERMLGHDQQAVYFLKRGMALNNNGEYDPRILAANACNEHGQLGVLTQDEIQLRQSLACLSAAPASYQSELPGTRWQIGFLRHDPAFLVAERTSSFTDATTAAFDNAEARLVILVLNGESGQPLVQALSAFDAAAAKLPKTGFIADLERVEIWPLQAQALALLGRYADAAALASKTPLDCYSCLQVRGTVAKLRGDRRAAQSWFLDAAKQAPTLAPAFVEWGKLLLEAHHYGLAEAKLAYAAKEAPTWADPLKYWGDALAGEGKREDAIAKYDAALKLAPNWQGLSLARGSLASH